MEDTHNIYEHPYINQTLDIKDQILRSYYAIYDGHGGTYCSDYMKMYLFNSIINNKLYINEPEISIKDGIHKTDLVYILIVL